MLKPWFLNLLLIVALVASAGHLVDVVGRQTDPIPEVAPVSPAPKVPPLTRTKTEFAAFQAVVDKNLFDADRGKVEPDAAPAAPAPPPVAQPPKASLFGIMVDPDGNKFAFLTDDRAGQGGKAKRYREGESLSGAKIKEIRPDRVIFTVGATEHVIALRAPKEGLEAFQTPPPGRAAMGVRWV